MADIPVEKKFAILCDIQRAQHFAWREAVRKMCPDVNVVGVVNKMWEVTGHQTAKSYLKRLDKTKPLAPQVAASIVWSSRCMGEDAHVEKGPSPREAFVRHDDCPWFHWHERMKLLAEDRPGCDIWFETTLGDINQALGTKIQFETIYALPDGGNCCLRRFWEE